MTITIELAPRLQAELARQAAAHGVGIDAYAARLIEIAVQLPDVPAIVPDQTRLSPPSRQLADAIETLRGFGKRHHLSLGGMTIRELRHEARP